MSKYKIIDNVHKFLTKIDDEKYADHPELRLEAKAIRWDLEEIFHFSASQPENSADKRKLCETCGGKGEVPAPDGYAICRDCR